MRRCIAPARRSRARHQPKSAGALVSSSGCMRGPSIVGKYFRFTFTFFLTSPAARCISLRMRRDLIIDQDFTLDADPAPAGGPPPPRTAGAGGWRDGKAFEVHAALREMRAARAAGDVCLGTLLWSMSVGGGFRAWGHRCLADYIMEELREPSPRRFQYLAAIERAVVERPLQRVGDAWRRGELFVSQAREIIQVATAVNEVDWLSAAASMSVSR